MDTLSEVKQGRFSRYPGAPLTGNFETESPLWNGSSATYSGEGTDWRFLDELKRKLKR